MRRILLVEDDQILSIALRKGLESEGYAVEIAADGAAGRRVAAEKHFDIIILDVMLPKQSGFEICERLRAAGNETPIIMLTARNMEVEKVQGLKLGADDYITKPFSLSELFARIEAILRRTARPFAGLAVYKFDDMTIDFKKYEATKSGAPLDLSPREFRLLQFFVERRGEVVSRDQILNHVWSYNSFPSTRTVDQHVAKLRQKIEGTPNNPRFLLTVHGVGYKFIGSIILFVVLSMGAICRAQSKPLDLEKEKAELLKTHQQDRRAHFQTDVDLLLADHPEEFIYVRDGKVGRSKKADTRKVFTESFKGATYSEWDDLEPPIVRVSNDGSLGWIITRLKVRRTKKNSTGAEKEEKFVYAGIMTYEKRGGRWIKVANVSTFEEP